MQEQRQPTQKEKVMQSRRGFFTTIAAGLLGASVIAKPEPSKELKDMYPAQLIGRKVLATDNATVTLPEGFELVSFQSTVDIHGNAVMNFTAVGTLTGVAPGAKLPLCQNSPTQRTAQR